MAGYILFMTYQNHPQPRYFAVVAFFSFFVIAQGAERCSRSATIEHTIRPRRHRRQTARLRCGWGVIALAGLAVAINGTWTLNYAAHPEYTFVDAAQQLTNYIDAHPNGNRLLVSISGDEITLITTCQRCATISALHPRDAGPGIEAGLYQPGW